jgi:hypothetical protein
VAVFRHDTFVLEGYRVEAIRDGGRNRGAGRSPRFEAREGGGRIKRKWREFRRSRVGNRKAKEESAIMVAS